MAGNPDDLSDLEKRMDGAITSFKTELAGLRHGPRLG